MCTHALDLCPLRDRLVGLEPVQRGRPVQRLLLLDGLIDPLRVLSLQTARCARRHVRRGSRGCWRVELGLRRGGERIRERSTRGSERVRPRQVRRRRRQRRPVLLRSRRRIQLLLLCLGRSGIDGLVGSRRGGERGRVLVSDRRNRVRRGRLVVLLVHRRGRGRHRVLVLVVVEPVRRRSGGRSR